MSTERDLDIRMVIERGSKRTTSRLRGRSHRSVAARFQTYLLASDLVEGFRRGCLPPQETPHSLVELRADLRPARPFRFRK